MAFKFPGMGFLSMLGGGSDSMPSMGGFGQMLGDFLKSPQSPGAPSAPAAPGGAAPSPTSTSSMPPGILQLLMQRPQPGQPGGMLFRPNPPMF